MYQKYPYDLIKKINTKSYKEITNEYQKIIKDIFSYVDNDQVIKIDKIYKSKKSLLSIKVNDKKEYINVFFKDFHIISEITINQFTNILKNAHISQKAIDEFHFLIWGDKTYNNTGKIRYDSRYIYNTYYDKLLFVNKALNDKNIVLQNIVDKYIFFDETISKKINFVLYKVNNNWKIINKKDFLKIITNYDYEYKKIVTLGPLILQSKARNIHFNENYESFRNYISIRWYYYSKYLT